CGSGRLCPDGSFELMQKREGMGLMVGIFGPAFSRPAITLKNLLLVRGALRAPRKRLQILYSDSNPSEIVTWLKLGITGLVLEMIEAGHDLSACALRDPMQAMRMVSQDLTLSMRLPMRDGRAMSALEIQRGYLEAARTFFAPCKDREVTVLLQRWENMLDMLSVTRQELSSGLDWMAKRHLLDAAASHLRGQLRRADDSLPRLSRHRELRGRPGRHVSLPLFAFDVLMQLSSLEDPEQSVAWLRRALRINPLREDVHRRLMKSLWSLGRRQDALNQFAECRELLHRELDVQPMPETLALCQQIQSGMSA
ncbi:MAG: proteasome accessory factor PafA2 family protein, partial [Candidatus Xenobia bacterium]